MSVGVSKKQRLRGEGRKIDFICITHPKSSLAAAHTQEEELVFVLFYSIVVYLLALCFSLYRLAVAVHHSLFSVGAAMCMDAVEQHTMDLLLASPQSLAHS